MERGKDGLPYRFKGEHGPGGALRVWCSVMSPDCSLPHAPGLLCPWDFPGKNTGVGCRFLLQGIFTTGVKLECPALASGFFTLEPPGKPFLLQSNLVTTLVTSSLPWSCTFPLKKQPISPNKIIYTIFLNSTKHTDTEEEGRPG